MDLNVFLAVLGAALCHAAWNAGLKLRGDPAVATTILAIAGGVVALPFGLVTGLPGTASWPWLAVSIVLHLGYFAALAEAYRAGDLGQVYPIARGTAPLITMAGSVLLFREPISGQVLAGILLLTSGVLLLSLRGFASLTTLGRRAVGFAFLTAAIIAAYTLVDGRGARLSGNPHAYAVAFFVANGLAMGAVGLLRHRADLRAAVSIGWIVPLGGGVLSFISYWVALWAMTKAPIAVVAAVRETSVLFAAAIGVLFLKEPLVPARIVAAILVMGGLVLIRLH